ncbi:MAG: hypothetical protein J6X01_07140 [Bacteroidales bacterium]|jgi:hypothetical protein|nr:hypothetical protein [Bacteroidales bacterium]
MKKIIFCVIALFLFETGFSNPFLKTIKITVDQEDAKIFVDNEFVAFGTYIVSFKKKEGHIRVRIEKEGFVTHRFVVRADDKRKSIDIILLPDESWNLSVSSDVANKFFTIPISKDYVDRAGSKEEAAKLAWKQLHSILMNYIEEIEESNQLGGYIQSAWVVKEFPSAGVKVRTRITIKETNIGDDLTYRVKVSSEKAPYSATSDEQYEEWGRVLKTYEPIIQEFQARLGKF